MLDVTKTRRAGLCSALRNRPKKASVTLKEPTTLVSRTRRNASRVGGLAMEMIPALLTRTSSLPYSNVTRDAAASTDWSSVTSIWIADALPLIPSVAWRSFAAASPLQRSREPRITWYCSEEKRRLFAVSYPTPWFPPRLLTLAYGTVKLRYPS